MCRQKPVGKRGGNRSSQRARYSGPVNPLYSCGAFQAALSRRLAQRKAVRRRLRMEGAISDTNTSAPSSNGKAQPLRAEPFRTSSLRFTSSFRPKSQWSDDPAHTLMLPEQSISWRLASYVPARTRRRPAQWISSHRASVDQERCLKHPA